MPARLLLNWRFNTRQVSEHAGKRPPAPPTYAVSARLILSWVYDPAKILAMSANRQWTEVGDGSGLVLSLGGELLHQAHSLLHMGLHPSDIIDGYVQAAAKVDEILEGATRCPRRACGPA